MNSLPRSVLEEKKVLPLILNSDKSAYSIARCIHANYGLSPLVVDWALQSPCADSDILDFHWMDKMRGMRLVDSLIELADENADKTMVLIPSGDIFIAPVIHHSQELRPYYLFNLPAAENYGALYSKVDFYQACEEYGIPYPRTMTYTPDSSFDFSSVRYPVVVKAADSLNFTETARFSLNSKIFYIKNEDDLLVCLQQVFESGYADSMVVQEYIPGNPTSSYSLNAYLDQEGKVRMMCLGQAIIDDPRPWRTGNHDALFTTDGSPLYPQYKAFLEKLDLRGFVNIDLARDPRDGVYKALEMNIRLPASMHFMTAGGLNFMDFYFRDLLGTGFEEETYFHKERGRLWLSCHPDLLKQYCPRDWEERVNQLLAEGYEYSSWYEADQNPKREKRLKKRLDDSLAYYARYGKRPEQDPSFS